MLRVWLKHRREKLGISQEQLAKSVSLKRQSISKYENQERKVSIDELVKLSIPLQFTLRMIQGEMMIMEQQYVEQLKELKLAHAWKEKFNTYLKDVPQVTLKTLYEVGTQLAEECELELYRELGWSIEQELFSHLVDYPIHRLKLVKGISLEAISRLLRQLEDEWICYFFLMPATAKIHQDSGYYCDSLSSIVGDKLIHSEAIHFKLDVELSVIESHFNHYLEGESSETQIREKMSELPINIVAVDSVFYVSEKQELQKNY